MKKFSYESMGTSWEITIWDTLDGDLQALLEKEIFEMSAIFDRTFSRFIKTSLVWKIAEKAGIYEVPEDFAHMLQLYLDLYEASEKKLNPLIGFTISDLGYDDTYSLIPKENIRTTPDLFETVIFRNLHTTETKEPVLFDFGALGKGYFVDKITAYLKKAGVKRFLVNGSGDIYYSDITGQIPIKVGLEHPDDAKMVVATAVMTEGSMCASGINRRAWDKYHHVIDPHTSTSTAQEIKATWVMASSAALSDALASCLFFVPPSALAHFEFEYVIMNAENKIKISEGWKGEFFS